MKSCDISFDSSLYKCEEYKYSLAYALPSCSVSL
ncbi:unnamed protein product [Brassica rapa subsp. narinosa]